MQEPTDPGRFIDQARGLVQSDIVLKGGHLFNLVTGELEAGDVAIGGNRIVGTGATYHGHREIDISGQIVVPGFIDTHLHVESSLVTPFEFDRCVLPYGVTTAICDPHELANVAGIEGIQYFLDASTRMLMDLRVQLSSCVPATSMETSGAQLDIGDLLPLADHPSVIGLAEFMNYPGVLGKDPVCMAKLAAFQGKHIDGHAPLLLGQDLNGYLAAGVCTEHEATTAAEALEKLAKGMHVLIREGSVSRDLHALAPIITERHSPFIALCTDDRNPLDIAEHGHLDYMIRTAIALGADPLAVYRASSISAANAFGLRDRGLIAPGWRADLVVVDTLENCAAKHVFCAGREVNDSAFESRDIIPPVARHSIKAPSIEAAQLAHSASATGTSVIGILPGKIITEHRQYDLAIDNGVKRADPSQDIIKIAVLERHGRNGNLCTGFVQGFGLHCGAIASTVCHDHHNIAVVGMDDKDMAVAANRLSDIEGGFVVVRDATVLAEVALPIGGLMSLQPFETVREELNTLRTAARSLGVTLDEPFLQLAFLCLPVIPHLKITDCGLVDVDRFAFVS